MRVLLLEDSPQDAALLERHLLRQYPEASIVAVDNRDAFLESLEQKDWTIILSDYQLPGFDGYTALLLARRACPDTPCFIVSGAIDEDTQSACMKAGATACIDKNQLHDLLPAVQKAVTHRGEDLQRPYDQRLHELENALRIFPWTADTRRREFLSVGEHCREITGHTPDAWRQPGFWEEVLESADRDMAATHLWGISSERDHETFDCRIHRGDGTIVWLQVIAFADNNHDDTGRIHGWMVDVSRRIHTEEKQRQIGRGLRAVVEAAEELIHCRYLEDVYRRGVELAREKLGVERCAIFVIRGDRMHGTYGTDRYGQTTREHGHVEIMDEHWRQSLRLPKAQVAQRWHTTFEQFVEWNGREKITVGEGWVAMTPLVGSSEEPVGVFTNDTAVTGAPLNPIQQTIIADYCAHLAGIIEQKRAEDKLQSAQQRYQSLVEQLPAVTYRVQLGPDRKIGPGSPTVYISPQVQSILGYTVEEWLADPTFWIHTIHPDDRDRVLRDIQHANDTGDSFDITYRALTRDEQIVWIQNKAITLKDRQGRPLLTQGVMFDITHARMAQEHLERRDAILEATSRIAELFLRAPSWQEKIHEALQRLGRATRSSRVYLFSRLPPPADAPDAPPRLKQLYEWTDEGIHPEIDNPDLQDFSFRDVGAAAWEETLMAGRPVGGAVEQAPGALADFLKEQHIQSLLIVPITVDNEWWGMVGLDDCRTRRDWSAAELDALQLAASLISSAIQRQQALEVQGELNASLNRARRMESMGHLAGGVAHDLNNILGPLVGYPDLILEELPAGSPIRKDVVEIRDSAQRATTVIRDLLTLARRGNLETTRCSINDVVQAYLRSAGMTRLRELHPTLSVETNLEPSLPPILASDPHLSQVIMNLVNNAAEASDNRGSILLETRHATVTRYLKGYEAVPPGEYAVLTVQDSGCGIPEKDLENIFDPFYTRKEMGRSGTGLGLTVVYGVVKDLNGFLDVRSTPGRGSAFTLYFPVATGPAEEPGEDGAEDLGGSETILVIDDIAEVRHLCRRFLKRYGYHVVTAENGRQAVAYLKDHSADLIVLDMIMEEDYDGLDTYRDILTLHPGQPCIIASGYSETDRAKKAEDLGAGQFIRKPFTMQQIARAVRTELDARRSS